MESQRGSIGKQTAPEPEAVEGLGSKVVAVR
jgi:hypothetical protein